MQEGVEGVGLMEGPIYCCSVVVAGVGQMEEPPVYCCSGVVEEVGQMEGPICHCSDQTQMGLNWQHWPLLIGSLNHPGLGEEGVGYVEAGVEEEDVVFFRLMEN